MNTMKIRAFACVVGPLALACGLGVAIGCSSSSETTTPSGGGTDASVDAVEDATADADTPQDSGTDTGSAACNALSNVGAVVPQMYVATDPVTGNGGAIATGTYVLTAAAVYTGPDGGVGPTGTTFADTLALSNGGNYERASSIVNDAGLDGSPLHQNGEFRVDGGSIQVILTCPLGSQPFKSYDSDGTKLRIYAPAAAFGPGVMFEYTKQ
jgi:hypothetical protein